MKSPSELLYTKTHEWVKDNGDGTFTVGITDYAQDALGNLVYAGLPSDGDPVTAGEAFCDVESVKAVSEVISPVTGEVLSVNGELESAPEKINEAPYEAWFVTVKGELGDELLTPDEYDAYLTTL